MVYQCLKKLILLRIFALNLSWYLECIKLQRWNKTLWFLQIKIGSNIIIIWNGNSVISRNSIPNILIFGHWILIYCMKYSGIRIRSTATIIMAISIPLKRISKTNLENKLWNFNDLLSYHLAKFELTIIIIFIQFLSDYFCTGEIC